MKPSLIALLTATAATAGVAQDLPQADNAWFTQARATLKARLAETPNTGRARNVIIMISDGNGVNTNYGARLFAGQQAGGYGDGYIQPQETFPNLALVKTYNTNAQTPDSAGTATAILSGVKTKIGVIGVDEDVVRGDCATLPGNAVTPINRIMSDMGKETGIVTTTRITHATPAASYAHTVDRNYEAEVPAGCDTQTDIASQLLQAMEEGWIDVALGGGKRSFVAGEDGKRSDNRNLLDIAVDAGTVVIEDAAAFDAAPVDGTPILGVFSNSHMDYEADRGDDQPSLAAMTAKAIEMLQTKSGDNGFFLQVEGGRIDHANHAGNFARTVRDQKAFSDAVAMADEMTDDADTLIIVTADHAHTTAFNGYCGRGSDILGLCMGIDPAGEANTGTPELAADGAPYTVAGYLNGAGSIVSGDGAARPAVTQDEATALDYQQQAVVPKVSETHAGPDVAAYARGPWSHLVNGTIEQNMLFHIMQYAATAK